MSQFAIFEINGLYIWRIIFLYSKTREMCLPECIPAKCKRFFPINKRILNELCLGDRVSLKFKSRYKGPIDRSLAQNRCLYQLSWQQTQCRL